jgi:hypothetical protein
VLDAKSVEALFFTFHAPEETSSWTTNRSFVVAFRGGPPELPAPPQRPTPGVIFQHTPKDDEVVLNLSRLYEHPEFERSISYWEGEGLNLSAGIKLFGNQQREVVIDLEKVIHNEIIAYGGDASGMFAEGTDEGVPVIGGLNLSASDVSISFNRAGLQLRRWVWGESVKRIYMNFIHTTLKRLDAKFS